MDREAFERARAAYGTGAYDDATLEFLFPQLKESEDERIRKGIIEIIKAVSGPDCDVYLDEKKQEKYIAWLEKQKEQEHICDSAQYEEGFKTGLEIGLRRQKEQKPAEWSEEDETIRHGIECLIMFALQDGSSIAPGCATTKEQALNWLKSLPERLNLQPKQEWSEKDKDMLNSCISSIEEAKENRYAYKETDGDTSYDHEIDWLKSLRPSWKPSEEQMEALHYVKQFDYGGHKAALVSLYEQLKQL